MDVELVHLDRVRCRGPLADGERELVTDVREELRPIAGGVVLEVVVADGRLTRCGCCPGAGDEQRAHRSDDSKTLHEL